MVIVVFTVVVLRYGFNIGFIWMQEVYVWLHSFVFMLGAGFTYLANEHVRIDVFYREASKKYKATVDLLGNIFLLLPFLYIIWKYSYPFVYRSFLMIRRPPRSTPKPSSAASDVYKRQNQHPT